MRTAFGTCKVIGPDIGDDGAAIERPGKSSDKGSGLASRARSLGSRGSRMATVRLGSI
jgi:hypothetical protein